MHSRTIAWKLSWTEEPGRLQSLEMQSRTRLSDFTSLGETGLGLTLCCSAGMLAPYKIQRNCRRLKITACMCSWGEFFTPKDTQRQKQTRQSFLESQEQKQCKNKSRVLSTLCSHHHKEAGKPPKPPIQPDPTPTLTPNKEEARSPSKALPESLLCPLLNFCRLRKAKTGRTTWGKVFPKSSFTSRTWES